MRCLLVDDEPGIREGLATLLRRRGHDVRTAADCASARQALAAGSFDVVVTDWRLPDGLAAQSFAADPPPIIVVSGHAAEVQRDARIHMVLEKPVTPARLLEAIAACCATPAVERPAPEARPERSPVDVPPVAAPPNDALPVDVQEVFDDVRGQLPDAVTIEHFDDGVFVVWRFTLPSGAPPSAALRAVRARGGDLRVLGHGDRASLELRLCRDGRPHAAMPRVRADAVWPPSGDLAVDCHGVAATRELLAAWLERAATRAATGGAVRFLNVPPALRDFMAGWESTRRLPMRERVGPRLPAELAELWS